MNIAKKCSKILVFGKTAFSGSKNDIYLKTKVVPNTFRNDLRYLRTPNTPQKYFFFEKNIFFIWFTIAEGIWNNFCFWVNIIFWPRKGSFPKNKDFGAFFGDIHIVKVSTTMKASGVTSSFFRAKFFSQFILVLWMRKKTSEPKIF